MTKKAAALSPSLVAIKGKAAAPADATGRQPEPPPLPATSMPLNFKVDPEFRRRFRQRAAEYDLNLIGLLREALDAWEEKHGIK